MGTKQTDSTIVKIRSHKVSYVIVLLLLITFATAILFFFVHGWNERREQADYQKGIQSFYDAPSPLPSVTPGYLIRYEKMDVDVPQGGTAYRILYVTQKPAGVPAVSSGMVFVPGGPVPQNGRKIIAWSHGTLGFGDECAPSRSLKEPLLDMDNWLDGAMQRGYIVAATDYTGIGTEGAPYYLIGESEAYDVINAVRAARNMPGTQASNDFIAWGHSQGGHSALFTAQFAQAYAPDLHLSAVAAAAPAAELKALFSQQYATPVAWGIGPDVAVSWPVMYPQLNPDGVLTEGAQKQYEQLANGCIRQQGLGLALRAALRIPFFSTDPTQHPDWIQPMAEQTPSIQTINVPIYIAQGLDDTVVLPNTTALLAQKACTAGRSITVNWLGSINHQHIAVYAGPNAMAWMQDRFTGKPASSTCDQPLPIEPADG